MIKNMWLIIWTIAAIASYAMSATEQPAAPHPEKGTWGQPKSQSAQSDNQATPRSMQQIEKMNRWLNEFSKAYQNRNGEKMGRLIERLENEKGEMPQRPRIDKWLANVKQAYGAEDVQKMGRLIDNAIQLRDTAKQRLAQQRGQQGPRWGQGQGPMARCEDFRRGEDGVAQRQNMASLDPQEQRSERRYRQQAMNRPQANTRFDNQEDFDAQPLMPERGYNLEPGRNFPPEGERSFRRQNRNFDGQLPTYPDTNIERPQMGRGFRGQQFAPQAKMRHDTGYRYGRPEFAPMQNQGRGYGRLGQGLEPQYRPGRYRFKITSEFEPDRDIYEAPRPNDGQQRHSHYNFVPRGFWNE